MEIVIQSLIRDSFRLTSPIHIRYSSRTTDCPPSSDHRKESEVSFQSPSSKKPSTYVVIQREYADLEPVVRTTFQEAQDVQVFIDRRCLERRKPVDGFVPCDRRAMHDRRASTPMLDILINVNGVSS